MKKKIFIIVIIVISFIFINKVLAFEEYHIGEEISYKGEIYHIIENSVKDQDYVTAIKDIPLTSNYIKLFNHHSEVPYYYDDKCNSYNNSSGCTTDYNKSEVKKILDKWVKRELNEDDLVEVDGYKYRILSFDDLINKIKYEEYKTPSSIEYAESSSTPNFVKNIRGSSWTMSPVNDSEVDVYSVFGGSAAYVKPVYTTNGCYIHPIINLKRNIIDINDNINIGDQIEYKDEKYYIIDNNQIDNYVTLLKVNPLNIYQILKYSDILSKIIITYETGGTQYDETYNKDIIDYWSSENFDDGDLKDVNGYKSRLITLDELKRNFSLNLNTLKWENGFVPEEWLVNYESFIYDEDYILYNDGVSNKMYPSAHIKPVINLKKSAIGKVETEKEPVCTPKYITKTTIEYSYYKKNNIVNFKGDDYYVLETSDKNTSHVTLLKYNPLTYNELVSYKGKYSDDFIEDSNGIGLANYFKSDTCYLVNADYDNHIYEDVNIGCTNEYEKSFVKNVLDNWSQDKFKDKDLVSIDGYKVRLLKVDELLDKLGYDINNIITDNHYLKTDNVPWWIYDSKYNYWTMSGLHDFNRVVYTILKNGNVNAHDFGTGGCGDNCVYSKNAIRPVINVDKCALSGGCFIDSVEVEDGCLEDEIIENNNTDKKEDNIISKVVVTVANTLKYLPQIILVISTLLIIGGISILGYNYIKSRRERK